MEALDKETEQESLTKSDQKDNLEERYNKLRGFALKLKKKLSDLSEELKTSESEKFKAINEKDEIQKKISQISDNLKKLQTIQLEYDKLQDNFEHQKNETKKLTKNLETVVVESTALKESNYELKETISHLTAELENRTKEMTELKNCLKKNQSALKKLEEEKKADMLIREQKNKEYEDIKAKLELEIQSHKTTRAQCTSNNVLVLEVDNYEKSIEDLKSKLSDESTRCSTLESTVEEQRQGLTDLENQLADLRDSCFAKTNQLIVVSDKNEGLKADLCNVRQEIVQMTKEKESLVDAMEAIKSNGDKLSKELSMHAMEKMKMVSDMEQQKKSHIQHVESLQLEISRLSDLVQSTNEDLEALRSEYEGYKLRAQSVLRTKQSQSKESGLNGRSVDEIETELNHLRSHSTHLQEKLDNSSDEMKTLTDELTLAKEERDAARENAKDLGKKLASLSHDYSCLREQCRGQLSTIEELKYEIEASRQTLQSNHIAQIAAMENRHQQEIENLKMEMEKVTSNTYVKTDKLTEIKSEHEYQTRAEMSLLEREDGEGSESIDSYAAGFTNLERNRRPSLIPLDELLNSSDDFSKTNVASLPSKVDRQELEVCERRVKHLATLLADAERDVAKLNQMNQLLKEDIRRHQRSVEREHHANNFEYLKNVIIKFMTLKNGDERSRLIPVLNTILKLSPAETQQLHQVTGGRSYWLPAIPIPGWIND